MTEPTETQVVTALGVIENCSKDDLFMLAVQAMVEAVKHGNAHEIYVNLSDEYEEQFHEWERHFLPWG